MGRTLIPLSNIRSLILNADRFYNNKASEEQVGIKTISKTELEIRLTMQKPYFLALLTTPLFYPIPMHLVEKYGNDWANPKYIVSNEPFSLKKISENKDIIILQKNSYYHDAKNAFLYEIVFHIEPNLDSYELYLDKKIDLAFIDDYKILNKIILRKEHYAKESNRVDFLLVNTKKERLNNVKV